jgi:hypothetical protein
MVTFKLLIADFFFAYMVYQQHPTVQNLRSVADNLTMNGSCTEKDVIWDHAMQQVVVALLAGLKFTLLLLPWGGGHVQTPEMM